MAHLWRPSPVASAPADAVEAIFRSTGKREVFAAWTLLFFALWHQCQIAGREVEGDIFDMLAAG